MNYIDAHVHVWTPDTQRYPLAKGFTKSDMKPASFTPDELFKHMKPEGVTRVNLIQMSYYQFDNTYMLDMIDLHKGVFVGTAIIDPESKDPAGQMTDLARRKVRAFRIYPTLTNAPQPRWLQPEGYSRMFAAAARNNQAISCLVNPIDLAEIDRMCRKYPDAPVIIDHMARIGVSGEIKKDEVEALLALARHRRVMVKVGAFYAFGKKKAPYTDLGPLIQKILQSFGPERCMWESDCPFQVVEGHTYKDSIQLIRSRLAFLTDSDKDWLLRKTAEKFFFTD